MNSRKSRSILQDTWIPETLAIVVSLLSFLAIIVLLKVYDDQPIFVWHGATLNTFVSTIATLGKAMLLFTVAACVSQWKYIWFSQARRRLIDFELFDGASRGPSGSISLLWSLNFRSLVSIGALVTILSLAIDPFVQQIIGSGERQYPSNSTSIVRALRYSRGTMLPQEQQTVSGSDKIQYQPIKTNPDFSMQSAMLFGLSNSLDTVIHQTASRCPGSHCIWEPYLSLGVCSTCVDVTAMVVKTTKNVTGHETQPQSNALSWILDPGGSALLNGGLVVNYTLPNGLYLEELYIAPMVSYATTNRSQTVAFQEDELLLYSLTVLRSSPDGGPVPGIPLLATECGLRYCINNHTSEMSNGKLTERAEPLSSIAMPAERQRELESWGPRGTPGTLETDLVRYISHTETLDLPDLQLRNEFNITQVAINSIAGGLDSVFARSKIVGCTGYYLSDAEYQPASTRLIYDSDDLNTTFTGLARSMSNSMRSKDDTESLIQGTVGVAVYNVRLKWMALPMITVFGGFLLLALTIFFTHSRNLPIWKSNSLSVLKIGEMSTKPFESDTVVGGMENKAKKTYVRLFHDGSEDIGGQGDPFEQNLRSSDRMEMTIPRKAVNQSSREVSNSSFDPLSFEDYDSMRRS